LVFLIDYFEGDEGKARAYVVSRLREVADICEKKTWPDIFGIQIPPPGSNILGDSFINTIAIMLSLPWPG
jgi:hypothetical protein